MAVGHICCRLLYRSLSVMTHLDTAEWFETVHKDVVQIAHRTKMGAEKFFSMYLLVLAGDAAFVNMNM